MSDLEIGIVSGDFYRGEEVREHLIDKGFAATSVYRAYHADEMFEDCPPVILGDGTCKDRDDDGESIRVLYPTRQRAHEAGAIYLPLRMPKTLLDLSLGMIKLRKG